MVRARTVVALRDMYVDMVQQRDVHHVAFFFCRFLCRSGLCCWFFCSVSLVQGEILLTDGRRFITTKSSLYNTYRDNPTSITNTNDYQICLVHPLFRVFALA